ncbi:BtrH N-terminal domain-containing protein [Paenibacillus illinoisensis]|uniref:BtrH N-terminal domain-containing protein n=1 Tax=Paenibacillus illinoisensis TaxID=59845 RepID=UPI001C8EFA3B|nr:BtrH N-terminal domain-containing protein [Paenibacillus illinoisensis]MBY0220520.1 hypothetical protein [Paenibacillus illinoisensis]
MKLTPIDTNLMNFFLPLCFEHAFASYSNYYHIKYQNAFIKAWRFNYDYPSENSNNQRFGERLTLAYDIITSFQKFCGINFMYTPLNNSEEGIDLLKRKLSKSHPVIIHSDTYYNEWDPLFMKVHTNHVTIAVDIDEIKKIIYVIEPGYATEPFELSYDAFNKSCQFYFDVTIESPSTSDYLDLLKSELSSEIYNGSNSMFNQIRKFAQDFENFFVPEKEFDNCLSDNCFVDSLFVAAVRKIMVGRNLFIHFLISVQASSQDISLAIHLDSIINTMKVAVCKWNLILIHMHKSVYTGWKTTINKRISSILNDIADIEEIVHKDLLKILAEGAEYTPSTLKDTEKRDKVYSYIPLKHLFNNKSFKKLNAEEEANFTGLGEFLIKEQMPDSLIWKIEDHAYLNPFFDNEEMENLACENQYIEMPDRKVDELLILCCAEWGSYHETIVINYIDGTQKFLNFNVPDISLEPFVGQKVAWRGRSGVQNDMELQIVQTDAKIFSISIRVDSKIQISSLVFPDCPYIHIYGLTTAKYC